jgi:hypothetical protein
VWVRVTQHAVEQRERRVIARSGPDHREPRLEDRRVGIEQACIALPGTFDRIVHALDDRGTRGCELALAGFGDQHRVTDEMRLGDLLHERVVVESSRAAGIEHGCGRNRLAEAFEHRVRGVPDLWLLEPREPQQVLRIDDLGQRATDP